MNSRRLPLRHRIRRLSTASGCLLGTGGDGERQIRWPVYIFLLSSLILGRVGWFSPSASVSDWGFCSPGLNHGGDFEFVEFPAAVEARCICSTLIMGESTVVLFPWLEFALSWVAGCSSGMFLGDAISVVYLLAKGMDLICSPRELFLLRWRLCRRRQTPVPVTGVIISDGGSLAALPRPRR